MERITTETFIGPKEFYKSLANKGIRMASGEHFNQYSDFLKQETFYECKYCRSLNVDVIRLDSPDRVIGISKECRDCGNLENKFFEGRNVNG